MVVTLENTFMGGYTFLEYISGSSTGLKKWKCQIFNDVGGPTMVGSNVAGEIFKK